MSILQGHNEVKKIWNFCHQFVLWNLFSIAVRPLSAVILPCTQKSKGNPYLKFLTFPNFFVANAQNRAVISRVWTRTLLDAGCRILAWSWSGSAIPKNFIGLHRWPMVLILDSISEIGAHAMSNVCYFICLRHLITSRAVTNRIFSPKRPIFLRGCATCSELPSNISSMI